MKIFFTSFFSFFLFLASAAFGKTLNNADLIEKDGLYYQKDTGKPFTGKVSNDFKHDKIMGHVKAGKRLGLWEFYHPNGELRAKGKYKDGKYQGQWEWYFLGGKLESKGPFKDGKYNGYWLANHKNGQLQWEGVYTKGKRVGPWVWYYPDGSLMEKRNYMYEQPGVQFGQLIKYHLNGQLMAIGEYKNGLKDGPWVFYEEDGTKRFYSSNYGDDAGTGIYRSGIKISD